MRFRAILLLGGKTATGLPVPAEVATGLGGNKRPAVQATINGYTFRTSIGTVDGQFMLPVSAEVRQAAGVAAGDEVEVDLELDTASRTVTVPPDLAEALAGEVDARRFFDGLTYSQQRWYVTWIESAKRAETRQDRVAKAVTLLREGRVQG